MPHRLAVALATTVLSVAGFASAASASVAPPEPPIIAVGPQQYFVGQINGLSSGATIKVICAGPAATGYPADGQTIGVALVIPPLPSPVSALGYTGDAATSITAAQTASASASAAPIAIFTWYANQPLSTKLQLPCSGTGTITFAPAPNKGGRAATVTVQFVSNTVGPNS